MDVVTLVCLYILPNIIIILKLIVHPTSGWASIDKCQKCAFFKAAYGLFLKSKHTIIDENPPNFHQFVSADFEALFDLSVLLISIFVSVT